jgi:hypothetical protein
LNPKWLPHQQTNVGKILSENVMILWCYVNKDVVR